MDHIKYYFLWLFIMLSYLNGLYLESQQGICVLFIFC